MEARDAAGIAPADEREIAAFVAGVPPAWKPHELFAEIEGDRAPDTVRDGGAEVSQAMTVAPKREGSDQGVEVSLATTVLPKRAGNGGGLAPANDVSQRATVPPMREVAAPERVASAVHEPPEDPIDRPPMSPASWWLRGRGRRVRSGRPGRRLSGAQRPAISRGGQPFDFVHGRSGGDRSGSGGRRGRQPRTCGVPGERPPSFRPVAIGLHEAERRGILGADVLFGSHIDRPRRAPFGAFGGASIAPGSTSVFLLQLFRHGAGCHTRAHQRLDQRWLHPVGHVRIDGRAVGDSPAVRVAVPPGPHNVSVKSDAGEQTRGVTVKVGEESKVRFVF